MRLNKSIVIVNEFTVKSKNKNGGTRGGTPGDYVLRYMAREDATETVAPVQLDNEDYILHYMNRIPATESMDPYDLQEKYINDTKLGGRAFSQSSLSLSDKELKQQARDIQNAFEEGKTVLKTVISFEEDYLKENGIIKPEFRFLKEGDYRGNIDQMKLRYAIAHGIASLSKEYDDLRYVGVIQVDTEHVHCHLAMTDMGVGNITSDGEQRGKLDSKMKNKMRRGIDLALDDSKEVQYMASNVSLNKRNIQTSVKRYIYNQMTYFGAPQKIMSCLPEEEKYWRASSNRKEMKKPNKICRDYVREIFSQNRDLYDHAMDDITSYADARSKREGLSSEEKNKLINNGIRKLEDSCINSIYATFKQIPAEYRNVTTDLIDLTSSDLTLSKDDTFHNLVYRFSKYTDRYDKHRHEKDKYSKLYDQFNQEKENGNVSKSAQVLGDFFRIENEYHEKLENKYLFFLFKDTPMDEYADEYVKLSNKAGVVNAFEQALKDSSIKKMKAETAEEYGRERYGIYGARYIVENLETFKSRKDKYLKKYEKDHDNFFKRLSDEGLEITHTNEDNVYIHRKSKYDFNNIKGLDIHDVIGDFGELKIGENIKKQYIKQAKIRINAYDAACEYLDNTDQSGVKNLFDNEDIEKMRKVVGQIEGNKKILDNDRTIDNKKSKKVVPINYEMNYALEKNIKHEMNNYSI